LINRNTAKEEKSHHLGIEIKLLLPTHEVQANVDRNQLRQLFLNLVNNAMDSMADGGELSIELEQISNQAENEEEVQVRQAKLFQDTDTQHEQGVEWIVISFRDTGQGIPAEVMDTLFEPFITTKETGTGLGLSICQQIAKAHGGVLRAKNRSDCTGAEFKLMIPQNVIAR
jgi:signal transduction histidine kinase